MGLQASQSQLLSATKALMEQWGRTRESWRDEKAGEFERTYITPLETGMKGALRAADELGQLETAVRRDCE